MTTHSDNPDAHDSTQYDLRTVVMPDLRTGQHATHADVERLDKRIDSLQAEIVRLVDIVQMLRLEVEQQQ